MILLPRDIPVIILIVDDQNSVSVSSAEYIVKPVGKDILLRKLKTIEKTTTIKRVLVVDNDPNTVRMIGNVLEEADYQVSTAYNSEDAIKSILDFRPDLIVLNLTLPETGFDVIEYLKTEKVGKNIPLIVLTQKELTEKETSDLNGRIQGILNKVFLSKEDLLKELKESINRMSGIP
jgi:CheY-like chemotaxis protein